MVLLPLPPLHVESIEGECGESWGDTEEETDMAQKGVPATEGEGIALMEGEEEESAYDRHEPHRYAEYRAEECEEEEEVDREDRLWGGDPLEHGEVVDRTGDESGERRGKKAGITVEFPDIAKLHQEVEERGQAPCDPHESKAAGSHLPEEEVVDAGGEGLKETHYLEITRWIYKVSS